MEVVSVMIELIEFRGTSVVRHVTFYLGSVGFSLSHDYMYIYNHLEPFYMVLIFKHVCWERKKVNWKQFSTNAGESTLVS